MGVRGLWSILQPTARHALLDELAGLRVAVDLAIWVVDDMQTQREAACSIGGKLHLRNLFFRVAHLLKLGVKLLFVIDGEAPEIKVQTMVQRSQQQQQQQKQQQQQQRPVNAERKRRRLQFRRLLAECCRLLDLLGVQYVSSPGEAESMAALLNSRGLVDVVITNDGDAFLYGAGRVLRNFGMNAKDPHVDWYDAATVAKKLGLDRQRLVALALLLGCDYADGVPGVGPETALKLFRCLPAGSEPLRLLADWASGAEATASPSWRRPAKGPHCSACGHSGRKAEHAVAGCRDCDSSAGCVRQQQQQQQQQQQGRRGRVACSCSFHASGDEAAARRLVDSVRCRVAGADLPLAPVVDEFLAANASWAVPDIRIAWRRPQPLQLVRFCLANMDWEEAYTVAKLVPLVSRWDAANADCQLAPVADSLRPVRVCSERVRSGVPCYEVQFARFHFDSWTEAECYTECVPRLPFADANRQLVRQFEQQQQQLKEQKDKDKKKTKGKKKKKKEEEEEKRKGTAVIEDFFPMASGEQQPGVGRRSVLVDELAELLGEISIAAASPEPEPPRQPFSSLFSFHRCSLAPVGRFSIDTSLLATPDAGTTAGTTADTTPAAGGDDSFDQFNTPPKLMARLFDVAL